MADGVLHLRSRPQPATAVRWRGPGDDERLVELVAHGSAEVDSDEQQATLVTGSQRITVSRGDWLVRDHRGRLHAVPDAELHEDYEPAASPG